MKNLQTAAIILFCIAIASVSCSCRSPVENDTTKPLWETQIAFGSLIFADFPITEFPNGVLFAGIKSPNTTLYLIDKKTGAMKWEWFDWLNQREDVLIKSVYFFENVAVFQNSPNAYGLDISTGKSLWRFLHSGADRTTNGLGRTFFFAPQLRTISQGSVQTGSYVDVFSIADEIGFRISMKTPVLFIAQNGDTMFVTTRGGLRLADATAAPTYLMLYNLSKKQLAYDSLQPNTTSSISPIIVGNKVYLVLGATIQCNSLWTGELLWQKTFTSGFLFGGVNVAEGKVFAGCEDRNFYCLDAERGSIVWQLNNVGGGVSKPLIMNGVVYFAPGLLYAVDVNSGQILWKRSSPDGEGFFGQIAGSQGKIYCQSYKSAYCYKAAR
jgi:outer membrane protein assembly factor BamB